MSKRVLVTGGLGNLGSWLTRHLVSSGYKVDVLSSRRRSILADLEFGFIECDITDASACREALAGKHYDAVIHAASRNEGPPDSYYRDALLVNALGTRNLLNALEDEDPGHFIYLSTYHVYGVDSGVVDEGTPTLARNDYGITHLFGEQYVRMAASTNGLPYTILRLTNSYGCPVDPETSKWYLVLNDLARGAWENGEIVLLSNGEARRDFIWMGDVVGIIEQLIALGAANDTFNLAAEKTWRVIDLAGFVRDAWRDYRHEELEIRINEDDHSDYPDNLRVDATKLRAIIPYECEQRFAEEARGIFDLLEGQG